MFFFARYFVVNFFFADISLQCVRCECVVWLVIWMCSVLQHHINKEKKNLGENHVKCHWPVSVSVFMCVCVWAVRMIVSPSPLTFKIILSWNWTFYETQLLIIICLTHSFFLFPTLSLVCIFFFTKLRIIAQCERDKRERENRYKTYALMPITLKTEIMQ